MSCTRLFNLKKIIAMKTYIKPAIEITNIRLESQVMVASNLNDEETSGQQLGNGRRGTWGNLWGNED